MTNPDTSTLNGALEQLGITMAENLVTMGVSDADPSDGLTTLAQKILQVSPTPASWDGMSLEKTAGKQILSYVDYSSSGNTEYCTVTAQLLDGASSATISGVPVVFGAYHNDVLITGSEQSVNTDSNGQASYTYTTQGLGDIVVKAVPDERSLLIQTYGVEDCFRYDDASSDKSSSYSSSNLNSLTYSTDHYEAYRSISGDNSKYYSPVYIDDTLPTDFEISVDMSFSTLGRQDAISIASSHLGTYQNATEFGLMMAGGRNTVFSRNNGSGTFSDNNNQNCSANTWYNHSVKVEGTTVTVTIKDMNDTVKYQKNMTVSFAQDHKKWSIIVGDSAHTVKFKNLKIKLL